MNVTSLELSKELHELSGWGGDCEFHWLHHDLYNRIPRQSDLKDGQIEGDYAPAYDLGYLLRKLRTIVSNKSPKNVCHIVVEYANHDEWIAKSVDAGEWTNYASFANTPEDAAAKLAIELFKQGTLTKGES